MTYNDLTEKVHSNAVKHGFWDEKRSNEHCLMLVITEIAECWYILVSLFSVW